MPSSRECPAIPQANTASFGSRKLLALAYGVACHALFLAAVGTAMVSMHGGMRQGYVFHWGRYPSMIWDAMLLLQFPLVHSFLLSQKGLPWLLRLAPRELARDLATTLFALTASLQMLVLYLFWSPFGPTFWEAQGALKAVLSVAYLGCWLFLGKAMAETGLATQTGFLGWSAVFRGCKPRYDGMAQSGLHRHTRHPIYLGYVMIVWCVPVWTLDQLVLALWLTTYCLLGPLHKEMRLRQRHGQAFLDYRRRVPYFLPRPGGREHVQGTE